MSNSLQPQGPYSPWNSPGQNPAVGSLSLLLAIVPTQGSNPGIPHCRWILYQLSHKRSPRTLEWVAFPFSRDLPDPGIKAGSPALQADSLPTELQVNFSRLYMVSQTYLTTEHGLHTTHILPILTPDLGKTFKSLNENCRARKFTFGVLKN